MQLESEADLLPLRKYKFHPYADLYPLTEEDQLRNLSEDIKANGRRFRLRFTID